MSEFCCHTGLCHCPKPLASVITDHDELLAKLQGVPLISCLGKCKLRKPFGRQFDSPIKNPEMYVTCILEIHH